MTSNFIFLINGVMITMLKEIIIDINENYKICPKCGRLYNENYNYCGSHEETVRLVPVRFK